MGACGSGRQCPSEGETANYLPEYVYDFFSYAANSNSLTLYFPQDDFRWEGTNITIGKAKINYLKNPYFNGNLIAPEDFHDGITKISSKGIEMIGNLVMQRTGDFFVEKPFANPTLENSKYCNIYCK